MLQVVGFQEASGANTQEIDLEDHSASHAAMGNLLIEEF